MNVVARAASADSLSALAGSFAARAEAYDRQARIPAESLADAGQAGLFALTVPRVMGGRGAGLAETIAIARRLGSCDPSATLILAMTWLQHATITRNGRWPDDIYRIVARDAVAGRGLINALRVEAELGTVHRGGLPATVAHRTPQGWRIRGRKIYSTGAAALTSLVVFARTDDADPRVGYFLVPADANGVRIEETWDHLGMRASGSHDVIFDDTRVPMDHAVDLRLPAEWQTVPTIQSAWTALVIAAIYLGVADAARDWLIGFLKSRSPTNLGRPLATLERMQLAVGEIEALRTSSWTLLAATAHKADTMGECLDHSEPGLIKYVVTENSIRAVQIAVGLVGNPALSRANPLERHLRDVLCARIHSPQGDSILKAAGVAALRLK